MGECVICYTVTSGPLEWCKKHYKLHINDIKEKKPWVKALRNDAQRERRRKEKEFNNISLDALMDRFDDDHDYGR